MLKMRLQQVGRKNDPHARVIVTDQRQGPKSNKFIEIVGSYDMKAGSVTINEERAKYWLSQGVQPSVTVHNMLVTKGILDAPKKNALPKKTAPVVEAPAEAEAEPTPAETKKSDTEDEATPEGEETPAEETETKEV